MVAVESPRHAVERGRVKLVELTKDEVAASLEGAAAPVFGLVPPGGEIDPFTPRQPLPLIPSSGLTRPCSIHYIGRLWPAEPNAALNADANRRENATNAVRRVKEKKSPS